MGNSVRSEASSTSPKSPLEIPVGYVIMDTVMTMKLDRITVDPNICFGKPTIRGMRIPVHLVVDLVAAGKSFADILDDYPELEAEDIKQALEYAATLTREKVVSI